MNTLLCPWESAQYFVNSSNIPTLFFYSHIPAIIIALLLGILILHKDHQSAISRVLFGITILFSAWCTLDLVLWATNDPSVVLFFWSLQVLIEPFLFALCIYLSYLFLVGKDMPFRGKLLLGTSLLPFIVFLATNFTLVGVSVSDCNAIEGPISLYWTYFYEIISVLIILNIFTRAHRKTTDILRKNEIKYFCIGIIMFLLAFSWGNLIGSFTDNWTLAQAGLIGMPILFGFLSYITVKFKTFNVKVISAQVLIFALGFLVLSMIFIRNINNVRIVVFFTLAVTIVLGYQLILGVKREIDQRKHLEELRFKLEETNIKLETANDKLKDLDRLKTEFLSLATHQIRSPLTAIKGYASMVVDGDFGPVNDKAKEAINRIFQSSNNLAIIVEDFLNVSKIESGGMKYEKVNFDFGEVVNAVSHDQALAAEKKGLKLSYTQDSNSHMVNGDKEKLRQVVINLIDNSVKYTKTGTIDVSVSTNGDKLVFAVKDTGMGMTPEIKATLFQKFARGEGGRVNTTGSGLGLYLAKEIAVAHGGHVWVDSEGPNKGSTFSMELNIAK